MRVFDSMSRWRRALVALRRNTKGVALVEFAISLPFLLLLYVGGYQLSDAIACNRKVTTTARALADLTSQYAVLSTADADMILNAAVQVMMPYRSANATFRITQLYTDANGVTTVQWSRAKNGTAMTVGARVALPATIAVNDNYLIYSETSYTYSPAARIGLTTPLTLADTTYMSPRVSTSVRLQ
jgi:Flp pilus assembly protein TadG